MAAKKIKEWYKIIAPKYFGEKEIGKTLATEPSNLIGKKINLSAIELTDNFSKYYVKMVFRINKVDGKFAFTEFAGTECLRDYLSRMVLRRVRRIDTVQDFVTSDKKKITVKGLGVIGRRVKSSITVKVSNKIKELLKSIVENSTLDDFIDGMISDDIKAKILKEIRPIYPLRNFEIRKTEVIGNISK
ncbi:MAG: 30S ribosomal protein S3ae [Candidatus Aenigmarchaeota archaeon]|nr:30S ribosomal protein S3ae [Candidatus Aenigmarchaeota archaeon]